MCRTRCWSAIASPSAGARSDGTPWSRTAPRGTTGSSGWSSPLWHPRASPRRSRSRTTSSRTGALPPSGVRASGREHAPAAIAETRHGIPFHCRSVGGCIGPPEVVAPCVTPASVQPAPFRQFAQPVQAQPRPAGPLGARVRPVGTFVRPLRCRLPLRDWDYFGTTRRAQPSSEVPPAYVISFPPVSLTCGNAHSHDLGAKGSQVHILSSRRCRYRSGPVLLHGEQALTHLRGYLGVDLETVRSFNSRSGTGTAEPDQAACGRRRFLRQAPGETPSRRVKTRLRALPVS